MELTYLEQIPLFALIVGMLSIVIPIFYMVLFVSAIIFFVIQFIVGVC